MSIIDSKILIDTATDRAPDRTMDEIKQAAETIANTSSKDDEATVTNSALERALYELNQVIEPMADVQLRDTSLSNENTDLLSQLGFLRLLWSEFRIYILEPFPSSTTVNSVAKIIELDNGRKIHDYGFLLSTSVGDDYSSYVLGKLFTSIQAMVALLVERNVKQINAVGISLAMRVAWIECHEHQIEIANYEPNAKDADVLKRLRTLREKARKLKPGQELRL